MASLLLLKRKIKTTQNVSKTTKAMQMIAASKLNRAQIAALASRPFVDKISNLTNSAAFKLDEEQKHPYMLENKNEKTLVIVFSPDKGLCGALVTNLLREVVEFDSKNKNVSYVAVGKKSQIALSTLNKDIIAAFDFGTTLPSFSQVFPILEIINEQYLSGKIGSVKIIYTNFKNVFLQAPVVSNLLPIKLDPEKIEKETSETLFEPSPAEILPSLLTQYIEMNLYQFFLENYLSYQAAQMVAMQNATDNANELIKNLKLEYNKSRQEKITNEILDISSAAIMSL